MTTIIAHDKIYIDHDDDDSCQLNSRRQNIPSKKSSSADAMRAGMLENNVDENTVECHNDDNKCENCNNDNFNQHEDHQSNDCKNDNFNQHEVHQADDCNERINDNDYDYNECDDSK